MISSVKMIEFSNRFKEKEELLKRQLKEIREKYEATCKENCSFQSQILALTNRIDEVKHKHELEIKEWENKHRELASKLQTQSRSVLDLEEKSKQLSDATIAEQQKYTAKVKELNNELDVSQYQSLKHERVKDQLETENCRLTTVNKKLCDELETWKEETRKLRKERSKLAKEIDSLQRPTEFDHLLGKALNC